MEQFYLLLLSLAIIFMTSSDVSGSLFSYKRFPKDLSGEDMNENSPVHVSSNSRVRVTEPRLPKKAWVSAKIIGNNPETVRAGDRVEITCEVEGSPNPNLYWIKGENPKQKIHDILDNSVADATWGEISRMNGKLVIDCVSSEDAGLIHCAGVSGKKIKVATTVLAVEGHEGSCSEYSKPTITLHASIMFANSDSTVIIPCRASGSPQPETYWIDSLGRYINSAVEPRYSVLESGDLLIEHLRWEDMGRYLCIAKSGNTEVPAETFLYPLKVK